MRTVILIALSIVIAPALSAQAVLFDFNSAPLHSPLPIDQTAGGITARLSATGPGYSIQEANTLGFTPAGFSGYVVYPGSIDLADLLVRFDQPITEFSILYACHELGCDDAATMRVTAFLNGGLVGTNTRTATFPGTWPVDTLSCAFSGGFDSVVVHYDSRPPTCQDYGTIFIVDDMRVTAQGPTGVADDQPGLPGRVSLDQNYPNPFNPVTVIRYGIPTAEHVRLAVYNMLGQEVAALVDGRQEAGFTSVSFDGSGLPGGVYTYRLTAGEDADVKKMLLMK